MEELRKLHNNCKREFITKWVKPGSSVLDCGCGRGGDLKKWKDVGAVLYAIDPDLESIQEAYQRSLDIKYNVNFMEPCDIRNVKGQWDVICYNFSIHYIFLDEKTLDESLEAISRNVKPGGIVIGIAPEKIRIETMCHPNGIFKDSLGNIIENFSSHAMIKLTDGPFYKGEFRKEPIMDGDILIFKFSKLKFKNISWEPMMIRSNGLISDMYTKFVFRNDKNVENFGADSGMDNYCNF